VSFINRKAQSGVEYMAVIGIALLVLTAGTLILANYSNSINDQVISNQLSIIGNTIMNSAESMYVLGNESWMTIEFNLPNVINTVSINGNQDFVFSFYNSVGVSNVVFFSDKFNISNGTYPCDPKYCDVALVAGINRVKIKSEGEYVTIKKVP
jgi:hypothetical protein